MRIAGALDRLGLLTPALRLREHYLARRTPPAPQLAADGLPLPPPRLRLGVDGRSADWQRFLRAGAALADLVQDSLADAGTGIEDFDRALDFGCGCGRVARHLIGIEGLEMHGCDCNAEQIEWCRRNLPQLSARWSPLAPPTSFEPDSFDFIYALSVLTHMDEDLQHAWIGEFKRLIRPGGVLLFTTLGRRWARDRLAPPALSQFESGGLVVQRPRLAGTNACTAYHPHEYVTTALLDGFSPVAFRDGSAPEAALFQDTYVVRAPKRDD